MNTPLPQETVQEAGVALLAAIYRVDQPAIDSAIEALQTALIDAPPYDPDDDPNPDAD